MDQPSNPAGRPLVGKILSREEKDQMLVFHVDRCRKQQDAVTELVAALEDPKQDLKDGQDMLKKYFDEAKADLGRTYSRKYLEGLIDDSRAKVRDLVAEETQRAHDKVVLSQPVYGMQPELFPGAETPTAAKDEMQWTAEGVLRGRRGDLKEIQPGDPPEFHQVIIAGFRAGQTITQENVRAAMEAKQRAEQPDAGAEPKNLDGGGEGDEELDLDEAARKLKGSAFMDRGDAADADDTISAAGAAGQDDEKPPPANEFEASPDELAKQTTRRAVVDAKAGATSGEKPTAKRKARAA